MSAFRTPSPGVPGDRAIFARLSESLLGRECVAWRKSYGRTGHLHFGLMQPKPTVRETTVHRDEGEWVLYLLDCDRTLSADPGVSVSSRDNGDDVLLQQLPSLVGHKVREVSFGEESLELELRFDHGRRLRLSLDASCPGDSEQWLLVHSGIEIITFADGRWGVQERGKQ